MTKGRRVVVTQIAELTITGLNHDGAGVGRLDCGQVVFVPKLLPGETGRVQIVSRNRRHLIGRLINRTATSAQRRQEPCILADHCGGCSLQHLSYAGQLETKHSQLSETLKRIADIGHTPHPVLASSRDLGYRNKATIPLERLDDGRLKAGYYRRGSHQIVNMNHCPVLDPRLDALIEPLKLDLERSGWPVDRDLSGSGGLRHLGLRLGSNSAEVLITLISSHERLPGLQSLAQHWLQRWSTLVGVVLNLQPRAGNALFGEHSTVIAGRDHLLERFCDLEFELSCDTFFQVNTTQAERVVPLLLQALPQQPCRLIDAYCGVGTFSLPLAAAGHQVTGLELHPASVARAQRNAARNGLQDCTHFEQGSVAVNLASALARGADAVLVDPPRKGLEPAVIETLITQLVRTLVYLSCDPATLARDLALLCREGRYRIERIQPLDFFPNTSHIETLVVLSS